MKAIVLLSMFVFTYGNSFAGVSDYLVYDYDERRANTEFDAVISAKVNQYYAFADLGLVHSYKENYATNNPPPDATNDNVFAFSTQYAPGQDYYQLYRPWNDLLQLQRNSIWLLDVSVSKCHQGSIETNRVYLIMKPTSVFSQREMPDSLYEIAETNTVTFGVVKIPESELEKSFGDDVCYINGHSYGDVYGKGDCDYFVPKPTSSAKNQYIGMRLSHSTYKKVFPNKRPLSCYVVVDIGFETDWKGNRVVSKLMKKCKKAEEQGDAQRQYNVGAMFLRQHKAIEAYHWFWLASQQGHTNAIDAVRHLDKVLSTEEIESAKEGKVSVREFRNREKSTDKSTTTR